MSQNVFVYGSLMYKPVLHALLDRVPGHSKASIEGYKRYSIKGQVFPGVIESTPDSKVEGLLLKELSPSDMAIFDEFEGDEYFKVSVRPTLLENDDDAGEASVYIWQHSLRNLLYGEWDPVAFAETHLPSYVEMCEQFVQEFREQQKPSNRPLGFIGGSGDTP